MLYENNIVKDIKIAYIGGGSRGWAWTLMNDLKKATDIFGTVALYDIDQESAKNNEIIGNKIDGKGWKYIATKTMGEALRGADFVVASILPATFDEMEIDVHAPEKYGVYQSVGDTAGVGGFIRALRTIPMMREIARGVREYCPDAWVINYTNPMSACIGALYREFPQIKAYGCCHEVFATQKLLSYALKEVCGIDNVPREKIAVNVVGVNHFTWFTSAYYHNINLFDVYTRFIDKYYESGYNRNGLGNWMNDFFTSNARVRMDLFKRYGYVAAAGDRHLAEFMDNTDYLAPMENVSKWMFSLTPVSWRKADLKNRLSRSQRLLSGEEEFKLFDSGEEGVEQIRALLGLREMVTNINIPNQGQISNLPYGAIVETNAAFRDGTLTPVFSGKIPDSIYPLISRATTEINAMLDSGFSLDLGYAREKFCQINQLKALTVEEKVELFNTMIEGTKKYLQDYKY